MAALTARPEVGSLWLDDQLSQPFFVPADPEERTLWHQSLVGHDSLKGAQRELRGTMLDEALARHRGSRSGAAKTLDVSRQAIQQVLQREPRQSKKPPQSGDGAPRS